MNPDLTGIMVIGLIGLTITILALICHLSGTPRRRRRRATRTRQLDITLGFRDPYR